MIQPMVQRLAGDADAGVSHVGEIRQRLLSRHVVLTEDHLAIGAVFGARQARTRRSRLRRSRSQS
jgi:hypothetical protein